MSNIISHQANGREYLLVKVPEDAYRIVLDNSAPPTLDFFIEDYTTIQTVDLPPGNWSIIGKASELSEQQAAELVERNPDSYRNYDLPFGLQSARESLSSLLSSLRMGEGNTLILKRQ